MALSAYSRNVPSAVKAQQEEAVLVLSQLLQGVDLLFVALADAWKWHPKPGSQWVG